MGDLTKIFVRRFDGRPRAHFVQPYHQQQPLDQPVDADGPPVLFVPIFFADWQPTRVLSNTQPLVVLALYAYYLPLSSLLWVGAIKI